MCRPGRSCAPWRPRGIAPAGLGVVQRQLAVFELAPETDLHALEAQPRRQGDGLDLGGETEVPVRDADLQFAFLGQERGCRREGGGGEEVTAGEHS